MEKRQFKVLYRQFLFRMVDLELLSASAQGDISKLLGQFAGLLVFFSSLMAFGALLFDRRLRPPELQSALWGGEHFLISTTMLVVGMFAVLSWDSTFPDRRDVLVLAPLPVRARTLFFAKVTAAATALGLTVLALHCFAGLGWPFHFIPANSGVMGAVRSLLAYWVTMIAAGTFILCCVLLVQGVAAQLLPRRYFLRLSAFLQMAAFCLFMSMYFLEPRIVTPKAFAAPQNEWALHWVPSYWFLGFFQQLNGAMHPLFAPLARRAWIGLALAVGGTAVAYAMSYFRTLKQIVEEPDIVPGTGGANWLPPFGGSLSTAVVQFSIRTLSRSRQHRIILAFFLGTGFSLVIALLRTPAQQHMARQAYGSILFASVALILLTVVGVRVVFSMPLALRANWIFRLTQVRDAPAYISAVRRTLFVLAVVPICAGSAAILFSIWPWRLAAEHLGVLALLGTTVTYICVAGFRKIPFTCSYLPGKSYIHMVIITAMGLLLLVSRGVVFEMDALNDSAKYFGMLAVLVCAASIARWRAVALATQEDAVVQFEEVSAPAIQALGLNRDGVVTTGATR